MHPHKRPRLVQAEGQSPSFSNRALNRDLQCAAPNALLALALSRLSDLNDVNCATALARFCRSSNLPQPGLDVLMVRAAKILASKRSQSNGRTLTSLAHSLGILGQTVSGPAQAALAALIPAACESMQRGDTGAPGAIATVLWSLGTLRWVIPDSAIVGTLCAAATRAAELMSAAELTNAAWGAARMRLRSGPLMAALSRAATALAARGAFTPQGLASTAWAFAKLRQRPHSG